MGDFTTKGFHHVTMVARDARRTLGFYRDVLGLRLVKRTVNFDLPSTYHLYFGDAQGSPGTLLSFFEWPHANAGSWGVGGVHHVALGVTDEAEQLKWKRWLTDHGAPVSGPYNRGYFMSIYFSDPDGQILEIATEGPGFAIDEPPDRLGGQLIMPKQEQLPEGRDEAAIAAITHGEPVAAIDERMALRGIHHVTGHTDDLEAADEFYRKALGLRLVKRSVNQDHPDILHYFWANYDGARVLPASDMTLFGVPGKGRRSREGVGQTHHVAYRAENEDQLEAWGEHLLSQGIEVTAIRDRSYFKSIYFRSPDGLLVEIATDPPGFAIDEEPEHLGEELRLPPWLAERRSEIAATLRPLD
ncbi:MAG: VOC family protein [Thermomicrobiales bacterium]